MHYIKVKPVNRYIFKKGAFFKGIPLGNVVRGERKNVEVSSIDD